MFKGRFGEKKAAIGMWLTLDESVYRRIHNVILPTSSGTTQIDHVLVSVYGLFVVETKNMTGWIFGSESQRQWTQVIYKEKYKFQNPLRQNYRHTRSLAEFLHVDHSSVHSVILFTGDCTFKVPMPVNVLKNGLGSYVRSFSRRVLLPNEVERIVAQLTAIKADRSLTRQSHVQSLRVQHASRDVCPSCGAQLVLRTARKGPNAGSTFLGCSGYPKCRYTRPQ